MTKYRFAEAFHGLWLLINMTYPRHFQVGCNQVFTMVSVGAVAGSSELRDCAQYERSQGFPGVKIREVPIVKQNE
jgi:hypothetical protein